MIDRDPGGSIRRWHAAEARLYPLITVDAELYEVVLRSVAEALAVLRERCATVAQLDEVDPAGVLVRCPAAAGLPAEGLDPDLVVAAACAARARELAPEGRPSEGALR